MTNEKTELLQVQKERELSYTFFSAIFFEEVNESFVNRLQNLPLQDKAGLTSYLNSVADKTTADIVTSLRSEYAALFLGMSATPVFTSESVYTSDNHCLMQEARDEVLAVYRSENLGIDKDFRQPEDHIAVELHFMAHMCYKAQDFIESNSTFVFQDNLEKQRRFLNEHLMKWVPEFCENIRKHSRANFYRPVADMLEEFIRSDKDYLAQVIAV